MRTLRGIEEAEVDARSMFGEEGKIDSSAIPGGAKGIGMSRPEVHRSAFLTGGAVGAGRAERLARF
jgi:hypothetical protein